MIYLVTFFSSFLFLRLSEMKLKNCTKSVKLIFVIIGLLLPTLLAAARDIDVGTDVRVYGYNVFSVATKSAHFSDMDYLGKWYQIEFGYRGINFVISRFTDNIFWVLGTIELFILVLVYQALKYYREKICAEFSISWGMLIFYFLFYNETLNLLRQSMAIAVVLFAFRYIHQRKMIRYCIWVIVAIQFHITAVIALVLYPLYYWIVLKEKKRLLYGISIGCMAGGVILPYLIKIVIQTGILGEKFNRYLSIGESTLSITQLIIRIPFILSLMYLEKKKRIEEKTTNYWVALLLMDFAFAELRSSLTALYRISLYFSWFKMQAYYEIVRGSIQTNRKIISWGLVMFFLMLWCYQNIYMGNNGTYPYTFNIM